MKTKRSKYDTNPLDQDVGDRATEAFEGSRGELTENFSRPTSRNMPGSSGPDTNAYPESEAPTRRIDDNLAGSYPSVFYHPPPRPNATYEPPRPLDASIYQPPPGPPSSIYQRPPLAIDPQSRKVEGMGLAQKWTNLLPYIPGHIGAVAAAIELLLIPQTETRARFHAAQGLALQLAILIIAGAFQLLAIITDSSIGAGLFSAASTIFLIVSMVKAYQGKAHHIAPLDGVTRWLDDKIRPRK
jgi:uncharacterized membrane protein